jgi:hypothetical protein
MKLEDIKNKTKDAVDYLVQSLESGHSEVLTQYLGAMARFHTYSVLCWAQHNADYIQLWHGDADLLRESLEAVQQTAAVILGGIAP